jgi:hypothetical protein
MNAKPQKKRSKNSEREQGALHTSFKAAMIA